VLLARSAASRHTVGISQQVVAPATAKHSQYFAFDPLQIKGLVLRVCTISLDTEGQNRGIAQRQLLHRAIS
jgi:hypothetical protein